MLVPGVSTPLLAFLLHSRLCCSRLCCSRLCSSRLCCSRLCSSRLCYSRLCYSRLCCSRLCCSRLCCSRLCYSRLCCSRLCYSRLCCSTSSSISFHLHRSAHAPFLPSPSFRLHSSVYHFFPRYPVFTLLSSLCLSALVRLHFVCLHFLVATLPVSALTLPLIISQLSFQLRWWRQASAASNTRGGGVQHISTYVRTVLRTYVRTYICTLYPDCRGSVLFHSFVSSVQPVFASVLLHLLASFLFSFPLFFFFVCFVRWLSIGCLDR